jgi:excisionase family DNA binding protein
MDELLLSTREAARLLMVSEPTIKRRVYDGTIPSITIGALRRIPRDALERWVRERIEDRSAPRKPKARS